MRRLLSLLLLAAFGLPVVAPMLALGHDVESHLPACCRRLGIHHCAMGTATTAPAFSSRCPSFPQPSAAAPAGTHVALLHAANLDAPHLFTLPATRQPEAQRRLSRERSRHKRGPPQDLL